MPRGKGGAYYDDDDLDDGYDDDYYDDDGYAEYDDVPQSKAPAKVRITEAPVGRWQHSQHSLPLSAHLLGLDE